MRAGSPGQARASHIDPNPVANAPVANEAGRSHSSDAARQDGSPAAADQNVFNPPCSRRGPAPANYERATTPHSRTAAFTQVDQ
jgi:hypothetical protein